MNINKAMKKQDKAYNRFLLYMCFIFLGLPLSIFLFNVFEIYIIIYLCILELLIVIVVVSRINNEKLNFNFDRYKVSIRVGIFGEKYNIPCDKLSLIHTTDEKNDFSLLLLSRSNFRNRRLKEVDIKFLKQNPYITGYYRKLKEIYPEGQFYYLYIKTNSLKKYQLLDLFYRNSGNARFTDEAIEKIKEYRN